MPAVRIQVLLLLSGSILGCGGSQNPAPPEAGAVHHPPPETSEPNAAHARENTTAAESPAAPPCDQALDCCLGYVKSVGGGVDASRACAGIQAAVAAGKRGEAACRTMTASWRSALAAARLPIPSACR